MIVLDSSAVLAALDYTDPNHERVMDVLAEEQGSLVLPVAMLSELTYMIERNFGEQILDEFLVNVSRRDFVWILGSTISTALSVNSTVLRFSARICRRGGRRLRRT